MADRMCLRANRILSGEHPLSGLVTRNISGIVAWSPPSLSFDSCLLVVILLVVLLVKVVEEARCLRGFAWCLKWISKKPMI